MNARHRRALRVAAYDDVILFGLFHARRLTLVSASMWISAVPSGQGTRPLGAGRHVALGKLM